MQVRTGGAPRAAHGADGFASADVIAQFGPEGPQVGIVGMEPAPVIENDGAARIVQVADKDHPPIQRGAHRSAARAAKIDAAVGRFRDAIEDASQAEGAPHGIGDGEFQGGEFEIAVTAAEDLAKHLPLALDAAQDGWFCRRDHLPGQRQALDRSVDRPDRHRHLIKVGAPLTVGHGETQGIIAGVGSDIDSDQGRGSLVAWRHEENIPLEPTDRHGRGFAAVLEQGDLAGADG